MGTRGRNGFLRRLEKVEKQFIRRPPAVDTRVVWERLLPVMGRGDPEAVRRALQDLPTWDVLIATMHPEHVASVLDTFATGWKGNTGRSSLALAVYHALGGVWSGPLAIPKPVREAYLEHCFAVGRLTRVAASTKSRGTCLVTSIRTRACVSTAVRGVLYSSQPAAGLAG